MIAVNTLVLVVILCQPLESFAQDEEVQCPPTDIGFLLDYSTTMNTKNFKRSKEVIRMLVRDLKVGIGGSRAGLITFSDNEVLRMAIGDYQTADGFNSKVDKIERKGGRTLINKALELADSNLFHTNYNQNNAPQIKHKVLFVITDGRQSKVLQHRKYIYPNLRNYVRPLLQLAVKIVVVAVGDYVERYFLEQMVMNTKVDIVNLRSRADIKTVAKKAYYAACRQQQPAYNKKCSVKLDLGLVLDASGSIRDDFPKVIQFANDVVTKFGISKNSTHAGVIVFSSNAKLLIKLNQIYKLKDFSDYLNSSTLPWLKQRPYQEGWMGRVTGIDKALDLSRELFSKENGDRKDVRNLLVFLTDGEQNPPLTKPDTLESHSKPLIEAGVEIIAVGFGGAQTSELKKIASSAENVIFHGGSATETFTKAVEHIVGRFCNYCKKQVNLGFVLDASATTSNSFHKEKELVKSIVGAFALNETQLNSSEATLITFSKEAKVIQKFTQDPRLIDIELNLLESIRGRTNILSGLIKAREQFRLRPHKDAPKILIVMTDGKQSEDLASVSRVKEEADELRAEGFTIIAVSIGVNPNTEVLKFIGGSEDNILKLTVNDKVKINDLAGTVVKKTCSEKTSEPSKSARDRVDDMELLDEMEDTLMHPYIS